MGFGHRVFRLGDPRAALLHDALEKMGETLGPGIGRLAFAAEVERAVGAAFAKLKPGRPPLQPNIEINAACCSTRSVSRAMRSRRFSRSDAPPAGSRTRWSSARRGG